MRIQRGVLALLALGAGAAVPALADDAANSQRLAALSAELKKPDGFRAAYKLVDAGANAVPMLLSRIGESPLSDERIELCLREIARTREGARSEIEKLAIATKPATRARLARALAQAQVLEAVYPLVDALDTVQEPLEVVTYGPRSERPLETAKIGKPVSAACASFGERAAAAIRKRLPKAESPMFRVEAVTVLGAVKSAASIPDLVGIVQDEKRPADERSAALGALAAIKSPAGKPAFVIGLASEDAGVRRAAARALAVLPDPGALGRLAELLDQEKDDDVRLEAIRALGALEDPLAGPPLRAALDAASKAGESARAQIVAACLQGLAAAGDHESAASVVHVLELGLGFSVEHRAAQALGRIPDLGTAPRERLQKMSEDTTLPAIPRASACWVLACRGEDMALKCLIALAAHKEAAVRAAVAQLLAEGKLDGAIPVLEKLSADESVPVRRSAVAALGRSEASIAGAALVRTARHLDQDPVVRRFYAQAFVDAMAQGTLDASDKKAAAEQLARALETDIADGTAGERRAQASTLARLGERATLLRIATGALATSALPTESRRAAIEALARMGRHEPTETTLVDLVQDAGLGDDAALALARLRGETFFEPAWRARLAPEQPYR